MQQVTSTKYLTCTKRSTNELTRPYISAVPEVGGVKPVNIFIRLVFPAPLCPRIHVISFSYMSRVIPT